MPEFPLGPAIPPCSVCRGEGTLEEEFCLACLGTGYHLSMGLNVFLKSMSDKVDDTADKVNDIFNKCVDILEQVTE